MKLVLGRSRVTINRYTSFASLVHLLTEKKITLLDPSTWDDKNDVFFLQKYKERTNAKSVFALCLSGSLQTYHHWRVFAGGPDGVCISFNEELLRSYFSGDNRVEIERIRYRSLYDAKRQVPLTDHSLKFMKHSRYAAEKETRIVFTDRVRDVKFPQYDIDLQSISRITLSPWLSEPLVASMKTLIKRIPGCESVKIYKSSLTNYRSWKNLAE